VVAPRFKKSRWSLLFRSGDEREHAFVGMCDSKSDAEAAGISAYL